MQMVVGGLVMDESADLAVGLQTILLSCDFAGRLLDLLQQRNVLRRQIAQTADRAVLHNRNEVEGGECALVPLEIRENLGACMRG